MSSFPSSPSKRLLDFMLRIAFIHPDLGIGAFPRCFGLVTRLISSPGGAERLVVDAALGLQNLGHKVDIYTSHHDPKHCFEETKDGLCASTEFLLEIKIIIT